MPCHYRHVSLLLALMATCWLVPHSTSQVEAKSVTRALTESFAVSGSATIVPTESEPVTVTLTDDDVTPTPTKHSRTSVASASPSDSVTQSTTPTHTKSLSVVFVTKSSSSTRSFDLPSATPPRDPVAIAIAAFERILPGPAASWAVACASLGGIGSAVVGDLPAATKPSTAFAIIATAECAYDPSVVVAPAFLVWAPWSPNSSSTTNDFIGSALSTSSFIVLGHLAHVLLHHAAPNQPLVGLVVATASSTATWYLAPFTLYMSTTIAAHYAYQTAVEAAYQEEPPQPVLPAFTAVAGFTAVLSTIVLLTVYVVKRLRGITQRKRRAPEPPPDVTDLRRGFMYLVVHVRNVHVAPVRVNFLIDLGTACGVGIVGGIRPGARDCTMMCVGQLVFLALRGVYLAWYAPYRLPREARIAYGYCAAEAALCITTLVVTVVPAADVARDAVVIGYFVVFVLLGGVGRVAAALLVFRERLIRARVAAMKRSDAEAARALDEIEKGPDDAAAVEGGGGGAFVAASDRAHASPLALLRDTLGVHLLGDVEPTTETALNAVKSLPMPPGGLHLLVTTTNPLLLTEVAVGVMPDAAEAFREVDFKHFPRRDPRPPALSSSDDEEGVHSSSSDESVSAKLALMTPALRSRILERSGANLRWHSDHAGVSPSPPQRRKRRWTGGRP
jgi:hypothetical protein